MAVSEEEVVAAAQTVCADKPPCARCRSNARAALEAAAKVRERQQLVKQFNEWTPPAALSTQETKEG